MKENITTLAKHIVDRKSSTNWSPQKCTKEEWDLLLEAASLAPSSWNNQPSRYLIVQDDSNMNRLSNALHRTNKWAIHAAGLIVQFANPKDDDRVGGKDYYLYDCGLAMMSLVYQAQQMGLTCRQMIGWDEDQVKQLLNIPSEYRIVVITAVGFPSSSFISNGTQELKRKLTQQDKRYKIQHIAAWEEWHGVYRHGKN